MNANPFVGTWTYRSLLNNPDVNTDFKELEGSAITSVARPNSTGTLAGTIGGPGWSLSLHGSFAYGSPMQVRFQGSGLVGGEQWIYDYIGWLVPAWPNSNARLQRAAIAGSVVRTIPHASSSGGVSPAGVVASFYAVLVA
jgi:hypothetical protein